MKEFSSIVASVLFSRVLIVFIFATLAVVFEHWWIVFFALLFTTSVTTSDADQKKVTVETPDI